MVLTSHVHGHLLDLCAVELFDFAHHADIVSGDEVDGNTLTSETSTTTDAVDVVLAVGGQVVVDDKGNLLDIDTTGEKVSGDEDTGRSGTELLHDDITLCLVHVTVHGRDSEVTGSELVGEPVDLPAGVAEDDGLGDGDSLVQVGESVELPVLLLNSNVELLNTFEGKLVLLDKDTDGVAHELGGDLEDVLGHGSGQKDDLGALGQKLEDVVDLLGETTRQHLVGLVEDEHLHVVGLEDATLDHVVDTARSADNDLGTVLEGLHVVSDAGAANAGVALDVHEVTDGDDDLLDLLSELTGGGEDKRLAGLDVGVDLLEGRDGEGSRLTGTGLGLRNDIVACGLSVLFLPLCWWCSGGCVCVGKLTLDDGHDGTLLNSRGALKTVGVDTTEELGLQVHVVEGVGDLIVVGLDLACAWVSLGSQHISQLRLSWPSLSHCGGAHVATAAEQHSDKNSPSGTSSRPLSAMIATWWSDYWYWTVVEVLLVAGLKRRILWIPPRVWKLVL